MRFGLICISINGVLHREGGTYDIKETEGSRHNPLANEGDPPPQRYAVRGVRAMTPLNIAMEQKETKRDKRKVTTLRYFPPLPIQSSRLSGRPAFLIHIIYHFPYPRKLKEI